jgi:hypothetical protein
VPSTESAPTPRRRRVAVAAPEYWPRPDFVALALAADELLLCDSFQYSRQSYQNRARLRSAQGWHWISIPLIGRQHGRPISDVRIASSSDWPGAHVRSLQHDYGTAPFFDHYRDEVLGLVRSSWSALGALTCATAAWTLRAFGCSTPVRRTSAFGIVPQTVDELATDLHDVEIICAEHAAARFARAFEHVLPIAYAEMPRHQNFAGFVPGVTALDMLFNYGPDARALVEREAMRGIDFK